MSQNAPWYAPKAKKISLQQAGSFWFTLIFCFFSGGVSGWFLGASVTTLISILGAIFGVICFAIAAYILLKNTGKIFKLFVPATSKLHNEDEVTLVNRVLKGENFAAEVRPKGLVAPELALVQFTSQVKAFALEWSYQRNKTSQADIFSAQLTDGDDILRRRWNEVVDTLSEFEIYLAADQKAFIQKILEKYPRQNIEAAAVFRDVAESFDSSWRRRGINIESAVVSPLKVNSSDPLIRRVLVGPWRASVYLARKGSSVIFSGKSVQQTVVARWEITGLYIADNYLEYIKNSSISINERLEAGIELLNSDGTLPGVLYGLMSLLTWIDLANEMKISYVFKHTNEGFVIEIRL